MANAGWRPASPRSEVNEMLVEHILPKARERLVTIAADAPVREAAGLMSQPHTDLIVVCDSVGGMAGVVTKTDA